MREIVDFMFDWKFCECDSQDASDSGFDDRDWEDIQLPHDYSIKKEFNRNSPATGRAAYLDGGIGWYRKHFVVSEEWQGKSIAIEFDGVYQNSEVYVNGEFVGKRPYGYISFNYDISSLLKYGGENVIAVKVDTSDQPISRWYPGSGIYRDVRLVVTNPVHIATWGTWIKTEKVDNSGAEISVETTLENVEEAGSLELVISVFDPRQTLVAKEKHAVDRMQQVVEQTIQVSNPELWSCETPAMYSFVSQLFDGQKLIDETTTPFGIRTFLYDANNGFSLNGKKVILKGVCIHHDNGPLGSVFYECAKERQIRILKEMGVNAIRTSHNPAAPQFLDLCDKHGILVQEEAFDAWKMSKSCRAYNAVGEFKTVCIRGNDQFFDEWAERDLSDMVRRDRNHPSIIMWSIGNEILEQNVEEGPEIGRFLMDTVKKFDTERPVTMGFNCIQKPNETGLAGLLDVVGYNYYAALPTRIPGYVYDVDHEAYPNRVIYGSEVCSALISRGIYKNDLEHNQLSEYDAFGDEDRTSRTWPEWSCGHEEMWEATVSRPWVAGEFIWTGFDYLGEPTPFAWPSRSSYFGIIDLCGFPKDVFYFYQSVWTDQTMLHILPHWNWQSGDNVDVWVYTNCESVELFLNGESLGEKKLADSERLHLEWSVPFSPGELKAIGRNNNQDAMSREIKTAGSPKTIVLKPEKSTILANGKDLCYVEAQIVDSAGNIVPDASNEIMFSVTGPAEIAATGNGDATCLTPFGSSSRNAFNGKCLLIVKGSRQTGTIVIRATADNLQLTEVAVSSS